MPLNVLVVGAGIAGPAFATLLQRSDPRHTITVIERFPNLRTGGLQLDLKHEGDPIVRKMGLMDAFKALSIPETGFQLVNSKGKPLFTTALGDANGPLSVTTDCEIMRGDIVKILYEAGLKYRETLSGYAPGGKQEGGLKYEFNTTVTALDQKDDGVDVTFNSGKKMKYDLVVAADGQGSRTRRLAFGSEISDAAVSSLGVYTAIYTVPRVDGEDGLAKACMSPGGRHLLLRNGERPRTQVYMFLMNPAQKLREAHRGPVEAQKEAWSGAYKGFGWQEDRVLKEMKSADDFYAHEIVQIKMSQLYKGRVVLLGDAGYCPSVFTGEGTTTTLFGAYTLAGELARRGSNVSAALEEYERIMKPKVAEWQKISFSPNTSWFPTSRFGISIFNTLIWTASKLNISRLVSYMTPEEKKKECVVPEYPELRLEDA